MPYNALKLASTTKPKEGSVLGVSAGAQFLTIGRPIGEFDQSSNSKETSRVRKASSTFLYDL